MAVLRRVRSVAVTEQAREEQQQAAEMARTEAIVRQRAYYEGSQYDDWNAKKAEILGCEVENMPQHEKLLAYSTQIAECVDFLSDRLGEGFSVEADADVVQEVIDALVEATDTISAENDEGEVEIVTDDLLREAMVAQDVPVYHAWDPVEQRVFWEFWESEAVEFVAEKVGRADKVIRTQVIWNTDDAGQFREITERTEYEMLPNEVGRLEACARVFWDEEEEPRSTTFLGLGAIPWSLLRVDKKKIRTFRGEALVSKQVMDVADRYNAVEQLSFLIARYNSHGNLVVIGDSAKVMADEEGKIQKDVADVLTFPGGTLAIPMELPTDPQMIEHQRGVLADAMYNSFGLTRVEPDTLQGLGGVTGYALEILNQKSEATFKRVARRWRKDFISALSLSLDVYAWKSQAEVGIVDIATGEFTVVSEDALLERVDVENGIVPMAAWWDVDPMEVFPDRTMKITMGTGYVVDDVMIREDFVAELISREEALRKRGYGPDEITDIVDEIEKAKPAAAEDGTTSGGADVVPGRFGVQSGSTVAQ